MKVLGICGGNGVILHPFRKNLIGNIEPRTVFHTPKDIQWKKNFNINIDKSLQARFAKSEVEVIIGAPDCGHSSVLAYSRAKKLSDPKLNDSLKMYIKAISIYEPYFFMMENLPKLLDGFPEILSIFEELSYKVKVFDESVAEWGNSQINRKRLILVGIRNDTFKKLSDKPFQKYFNLPEKPLKTCEGLYGDLSVKEDFGLGHVRELDDWRLPMYYGDKRNISVGEARKLWLRFGTRKWEVNSEKMKNQPGVYRNLDSDYPMTVRKQSRQFRENGYLLTPREMARIQGIPDDFNLHFEDSKRKFWINKARVTVTKCPPYEIGQWFKNNLTKIEKNETFK